MLHTHTDRHIHTHTVKITLTLRKVYVAAAAVVVTAPVPVPVSPGYVNYITAWTSMCMCVTYVQVCVFVCVWVCTCLTYNVIKKGWEWYLCSWSVSQPALMGIANGQRMKEKRNKTADKYRQTHMHTDIQTMHINTQVYNKANKCLHLIIIIGARDSPNSCVTLQGVVKCCNIPNHITAILMSFVGIAFETNQR